MKKYGGVEIPNPLPTSFIPSPQEAIFLCLAGFRTRLRNHPVPLHFFFFKKERDMTNN